MIARHLGLAEGTVKSHLVQIFKALGVHNRTAAVMAAQEPFASAKLHLVAQSQAEVGHPNRDSRGATANQRMSPGARRSSSIRFATLARGSPLKAQD
jgi:hypothetical protein